MTGGDVGLFGPGSAAWRINREALLLGGGSCALLMQLAHPVVAAGVAQHSDFRTGPLRRLRRTLDASYAVVFGDSATVERTLRRTNAVHRAVVGEVPETGAAYRALDPEPLLWVHATLVDTALRVYERFIERLSEAESEAYYAEATRIATALGVPEADLPPTLAALRGWMAGLIEAGTVRVTPTARALAQSVLYPTRFPPRLAWDAAHLLSFSVLPDPIRRGYRIGWSEARDRGMRRAAAVSRRLLPRLPAVLRHLPAARAAEARAGRTL